MSGQPGQTWQLWTDEEREIMAREYPIGGYRAVHALLPHRSQNKIRAMATRMQVRVDGHTYVKQPATEWIDAAITRAYRTAPRSPDLAALAKTLGRTKGWIKWRAEVLGVRRRHVGAIGKPDMIWTPEEDALLERSLERGMTVSAIRSSFVRHGYRRSIGAILSRVHQKSLAFDRNWWTANETAQALNLDSKVVLGWIHKGVLTARRTHGPTADPKETQATIWAIDRADLRGFLARHPFAWDHRRVNIEVLLELLCFDRTHTGLGAFAGERTA